MTSLKRLLNDTEETDNYLRPEPVYRGSPQGFNEFRLEP